MKLRLRFALTSVAVVVPAFVGLVWVQASMREREGEAWILALTRAHMQEPEERQRCEADPAWVGRAIDEPRIPPTLYAYDDELRSRNASAPAIDPELAAAIRAGRDVSARRAKLAFGRVVEVLVRMPWHTGPCAFVLARAPSGPSAFGLPPVRMWLAPMIVIFAAMLAAMGPVVRRIRRLTEAVRRVARAHYTSAVPIEGSDEIAELARAFDDAAREIRDQLAEKERRELALRHFVANTTHDVMIPLTVLKGHLTALAQRAAGGHAADPAQVTAAMNEAHYMASLVHNLAIAAKLEAGEAQAVRAPVDLNELVSRVVGRHAPIARQLEVSLDSAAPEPPIVFVGDVTLLEQAVSNVVHNAIRYNHAGGHVAVILERDDAAEFRLSVIDDGPGIAAADLARITERGFRGDDARTRAPEGQGLGLHIAFRVAHMHSLKLDIGASEFGGLRVEWSGRSSSGALSHGL